MKSLHLLQNILHKTTPTSELVGVVLKQVEQRAREIVAGSDELDDADFCATRDYVLYQPSHELHHHRSATNW